MPVEHSAQTAEASPNTDTSKLPPGISLLGTASIDAFQPQGETKKVTVSMVPVEGQPFKNALRAEIKEGSGSEWSVQVQAKSAAAVEKGDALLASFYVRSVKPQENGITETQFVFEKAGEPYTKSVTYDLRLTPEWRKVLVRFTAAESYPAGGAQLIFRLGYDPQVFEVGGIEVLDYQKQVAFTSLPNTAQADRTIAQSKLPVEPPLTLVDAGDFKLQVTPTKVVRPISPYVYGINAQNIDASGTTIRRLGGNRGSVHNWELNASNAGNDWRHVNDDWPCTTMGYKDCDKPGAQYLDFVQDDKKAKIESIVTVPMLDYLSADKNQEVKEEEKPPSKRFVKNQAKKNGPLSLNPDLKDGVVYQDEFVNFLVSKLGKASAGGARFYSLDNEPGLWSSTHPRVHPEPTGYREIVQRTEATASAILGVDPTASILGAVMFGWSEFIKLSATPEANELNAKYGSYIEYFLASMKELEQKHGKRLVHSLDLHWYPEVRGTKRITEDDTSRKTVAARLQAPRSLWDSTYQEKSWIGDQWGKPIRLIPWVQEMVAKRYPGTQVAMTEYNFGAGDHISGGLAQADVLGILGREGVYIANYWGAGAGVGDLNKYILAAFKLYRNYDGKGGHFGDTAVLATTADQAEVSIYAAIDSKKPNTLTVIVINKDLQKNFHAKLALEGAGKYTRAQPYVLDGSGPEIKPAAPVTLTGNKLDYALPPLTAVLFACEKG